MTKLSTDECVRRLESEAVRFRFWKHLRGLYPEGTIFRRVRGTSVLLRACLGQRLSNSFEPVFRGSLEPRPEGTLIRGEFGMHRGTRTFMAFWMGFAAAMLILIAGVVVRDMAKGQASAESTPYLGVLVAAALLVFGWALWRVGKRLGAKQRAAIENFLRANLQAREKADADSVSYKRFEILPASQKLPGQDRWRLEFVVQKYNENGDRILEKTIVADNTFRTKKKADIWAIRLAKQMIDGEVPGAILEDT